MGLDMSIYKKNWIIPGMEVCHIDNPEIKMRAEEIVRREVKTEVGVITLVIGVRCTWFEALANGSKKARYMVYHTNTLLPWEVSIGGPVEISKFLNR
jgi:hypothetical protein